MKGTIARCLEEMVKERFGDEKWAEILERSGLPKRRVFMTTEDVPDEAVVAMIGVAAKVLGVSTQAAMDAFGEHWSTKYAPSIYGVYFDKAKSAREFLLQLDDIHVTITRRMKDAAPPRFDYDDSSPDGLVMHYKSKRGLVALMPGLVHGVAAYYKEKVNVVVEGNAVRIKFLSAQSRRAA